MTDTQLLSDIRCLTAPIDSLLAKSCGNYFAVRLNKQTLPNKYRPLMLLPSVALRAMCLKNSSNAQEAIHYYRKKAMIGVASTRSKIYFETKEELLEQISSWESLADPEENNPVYKALFSYMGDLCYTLKQNIIRTKPRDFEKFTRFWNVHNAI